MTKITERGMIFNGQMVRALLDGRKTQTRRSVKPQPELTERSGFSWNGALYGAGSDERETNRNFAHAKCPYGRPGDRIWVRETFGDCGERLVYRADTDDGAKCKVKRWTPSIHMPRWASRILLEITDVRIERLNSISDADCIAEGIIPVPKDRDDDHQFWRDYHLSGDGTFCVHSPRESFESLWKSVRGKSFEQEEDTAPGSWQANPWVWVIEFKRIEGAGHETD
ncbi:MAG: hypothetical protein E6736_11355 [Leclercia adecarboxylata]|nr:hypothetical protein [Leclercia adecarboxylata]